MVSIDLVKQLRDETGISVSDCKKALEETGGKIDEAKETLRKWGKDIAKKKGSRVTEKGIIDIYLHPNKKVGVMLQINCETDFVAKSDDFKNLSHDICLQIAAMSPTFVDPEQIPKEVIAKEKKVYKEQMKDSDKPQNIAEQIIKGKIKKYKEESSLLAQPWIKDNAKTIEELIHEYIAKLGENILVKQFIRYEI